MQQVVILIVLLLISLNTNSQSRGEIPSHPYSFTLGRKKQRQPSHRDTRRNKMSDALIQNQRPPRRSSADVAVLHTRSRSGCFLMMWCWNNHLREVPASPALRRRWPRTSSLPRSLPAYSRRLLPANRQNTGNQSLRRITLQDSSRR